ncbi:MAG: hypothetical protein KDB74_01480 [Flavobacteriales bacterium]|nr:hypothetical protein [Flavobacteriales bacterium]
MLKGFPKLKIDEKAVSLLQDNVATAFNNIQVLFKNLVPGKIVLTDNQTNLISSDVDSDILVNLEGLTGNIQDQLDSLESDKLDIPVAQSFTPTVTLVGGVGNTVPEYSQNIGRYTKIGPIVNVDIYLEGDGGNEGAGTGVLHIDLPLAAGADNPTDLFPVGRAENGGTEYLLYGRIIASGTTLELFYWSSITVTTQLLGNLQNSAVSRTIRAKFFYETDL